MIKIQELAPKVSNDISEGIDCGESREQLRLCIKWWANEYYKLSCELTEEQDKVLERNAEIIGLPFEKTELEKNG